MLMISVREDVYLHAGKKKQQITKHTNMIIDWIHMSAHFGHTVLQMRHKTVKSLFLGNGIIMID